MPNCRHQLQPRSFYESTTSDPEYTHVFNSPKTFTVMSIIIYVHMIITAQKQTRGCSLFSHIKTSKAFHSGQEIYIKPHGSLLLHS